MKFRRSSTPAQKRVRNLPDTQLFACRGRSRHYLNTGSRNIFPSAKRRCWDASAFARKPAEQLPMAHAHDWGRYFRRANRIDVCHLLQAQPNVRASETRLARHSKDRRRNCAFSVEIIYRFFKQFVRPHPLLQTKQQSGRCEPALGAERRLLEAVLIHKHRARLSPRLIPGSLPSQCVARFRYRLLIVGHVTTWGAYLFASSCALTF